MKSKSGIDSVTILCILAIILLVVIMVLPPVLRILEDNEEEEATPVEKVALSINDLETMNKTGLIECSKDNNTMSFYYKDNIVYQLNDVTKYDRKATDSVEICNQRTQIYKDIPGINSVCEYDVNNFVATFIFNFNVLENDNGELPIPKNSNIKEVIKGYIENNYTCYLK